MPVGWFLAPYARAADPDVPRRYCAMDDFTAQVWADNGYPDGNVLGSPTFWSECECLGDAAVVKVRASAATLAAIAATTGFSRIPVARLDDPLSTLTAAQKSAIRTRVLALGYTSAEVSAALPGDLGDYTLRDLLRFVLRRRLAPSYDPVADAFVFDGPPQPTRPLDDADEDVA